MKIFTDSSVNNSFISRRSWHKNSMDGLGPDRSGIYPETGLLKAWPSAGPALLWESTEIGTGFSSVTVTDDAIYITGRRGENDVLTAFSQDGRKKWDVSYGKVI